MVLGLSAGVLPALAGETVATNPDARQDLIDDSATVLDESGPAQVPSDRNPFQRQVPPEEVLAAFVQSARFSGYCVREKKAFVRYGEREVASGAVLDFEFKGGIHPVTVAGITETGVRVTLKDASVLVPVQPPEPPTSVEEVIKAFAKTSPFHGYMEMGGAAATRHGGEWVKVGHKVSFAFDEQKWELVLVKVSGKGVWVQLRETLGYLPYDRPEEVVFKPLPANRS